MEKTPCAIGYSGFAYATSRVKFACIAKHDNGLCVRPSITSAGERSYPIARPLFMYSKGSANPLTQDYLDWILSDSGQCILLQKGYAPIRQVECK